MRHLMSRLTAVSYADNIILNQSSSVYASRLLVEIVSTWQFYYTEQGNIPKSEYNI